MSALLPLGASSRPSQLSDAGQAQGRSTGTDFASMITREPAASPKATTSTVPQPRDPSTSRADKGKDKSTAAHDNQGSATGNTGTDTAQRRGAEAGQTQRAAGEAGKSETKPTDSNTAATEDDHDQPWPPAGLAGFGMTVMPVLTSVLPGAVDAPLQAGGLAISLTGAATNGIAGLLGGQPDAPNAAGLATGPAASGASAAAANGNFTGLLALAASTANPGNADAAPMAALAGAGDSQIDDASDMAGADPINLLASVTTGPASRVIDARAPFSGSPTPTPDLNSDTFDEAVGTRMSWLADQKIGHAHIKISPAELGPIEVRMHLNGDQVNASFTSAQADVRQALENSLPRLRDMLGQHGFQLGQADVGQQQQQASHGGSGSSGANGGNPANDELQGTAGIPAGVLRQRGLLDAYA